MSNLTISVDEQLIKRARMRAIEQGTSVSAKVREFLQAYAGGSQDALAQQRAESTARLLAAMDAAAAVSVPAPALAGAPAARAQRRSLRDEIYEGDFRARDRATAKAAGTRAKGAGPGKVPKPRAMSDAGLHRHQRAGVLHHCRRAGQAQPGQGAGRAPVRRR